MSACAVCGSPSGGWGWMLPTVHVLGCSPAVPKDRCQQRFCSRRCQNLHYHYYQQEKPMNALEAHDRAQQAVLAPLADYVVTIGMEKGLGDYTREEIAGLVETVLTSYQQALQGYYQEGLPNDA